MLRVAALQYCASDDVAKTLHHIQPLIAEAASKASLVALPECANYLAASREQLFQKAEWDDESYSQKWLGNIAREFGIWLLAGSLIMRRRDNNQLANRSLLFGPDGEMIAYYDKIHMFDADVGDGKMYRESASFSAGQSPVIAHIDNVPCGLTICYDVRFAHLYRQLALDGAQLFWCLRLLPRSAAKLIGTCCCGQEQLKLVAILWRPPNLAPMPTDVKPMVIR